MLIINKLLVLAIDNGFFVIYTLNKSGAKWIEVVANSLSVKK